MILLMGGVSGPGGVCSGGVCSRGCLLLGGVCSGGCLLRGVSAPGAGGGRLPGGGPPGADTPYWNAFLWIICSHRHVHSECHSTVITA